jgi:drug/metabolite transporter (DMT)-like permease
MSFGYVAFVSQYVAFFVFNAALAMGCIARVGQIMLLQPFVIVTLALPINGEPIDSEIFFRYDNCGDGYHWDSGRASCGAEL